MDLQVQSSCPYLGEDHLGCVSIMLHRVNDIHFERARTTTDHTNSNIKNANDRRTSHGSSTCQRVRLNHFPFKHFNTCGPERRSPAHPTTLFSTQPFVNRSNGNFTCSCRQTFGQRGCLDNLLVVLECSRFPVRIPVALANTLHDGDGRVLRQCTFLATVGKAVNLVVRVAAVEERDRVTLLATLVDHPVEIADVAIVRPGLVSLPTNDGFKFCLDLPSHEHVSKIDNVCAFDRSNVEPLPRALLPDLQSIDFVLHEQGHGAKVGVSTNSPR